MNALKNNTFTPKHKLRVYLFLFSVTVAIIYGFLSVSAISIEKNWSTYILGLIGLAPLGGSLKESLSDISSARMYAKDISQVEAFRLREIIDHREDDIKKILYFYFIAIVTVISLTVLSPPVIGRNLIAVISGIFICGIYGVFTSMSDRLELTKFKADVEERISVTKRRQGFRGRLSTNP